MASLVDVGTSIAGRGLGNIMTAGDRSKLSRAFDRTPYGGFQAGGLTSGVGPGGQINVSSSEERQGYVQSISDLFRQHGTDIREDMLPNIAPGMGRLTTQAVGALRTRRDKAISTLSENLAKRRVGGSSFAMSAMGNVESEFARQEADVRAENYMKELMLTEQYRTQAYQNEMKAFNTMLSEMNLQYGIADRASTNLISALASLQQLEIGTLKESIAGTSEFAGTVASGVGGYIKGKL